MCESPGRIHTGQNSGFQAIGLAYQFGVSRMILMGYDMQFTGGKAHWHADHPGGLANAQGVDRWPRHFPALAADLERIGVEVINCTRETLLTCFRRAKIEDVLP